MRELMQEEVHVSPDLDKDERQRRTMADAVGGATSERSALMLSGLVSLRKDAIESFKMRRLEYQVC